MSETKEYKEVEQGNIFPFVTPGDLIEGKLVRREPGQFGDNYVILCESGEEFVIFGSTVINTKLAGVKENTQVRITYMEEKKSGAGRLYKDFKVEVAA